MENKKQKINLCSFQDSWMNEHGFIQQMLKEIQIFYKTIFKSLIKSKQFGRITPFLYGKFSTKTK